jgi:2'-5' RNA ligase
LSDDVSMSDGYEELWTQNLPAFRRNEIHPEPDPVPGDSRWGVSALLRASISEPLRSLARAAQEIGQAAGDHQVVYGVQDLHVTVRSIEGFREDITPDDPAVERYAQIIEEEVLGDRAFPIRFRGVAPTRSGVIAPGFPADRALQRLRERLHPRLAAEAIVTGPESRAPRRLVHASLLLFTDALADPTRTVATLESYRSSDFGIVIFDRIDLVRYERTPTEVRIHRLRRIVIPG